MPATLIELPVEGQGEATLPSALSKALRREKTISSEVS